MASFRPDVSAGNLIARDPVRSLMQEALWSTDLRLPPDPADLAKLLETR